MINALGAMGDGTWASSDPSVLGGSQNRAAPGTITSGVSLNQIQPWSREGMLMTAMRSSVSGTYTQAAAAQGIKVPSTPIATVKVAGPVDTGPSVPVMAGAAIVGLGVLAAIVYKLRKR